MNEHTLCCGSVADKAKLCAEIAEREQRIKALEIAEGARARVIGRTRKFAIERGYNPASDEDELEYIMRRFDEMAAHVERLLDAANNYLYYSDDCSSPSLYSAEKDNLETVLLETPPAALAALKAQWNCPTVEHGKNRYGLDVGYFRNLFNRELNRTLQNYRPDELARNLLRMARTADKSIIAESEFTGELKAQWRHDAILEAVENTEHVLRIGHGSWLCHVKDLTEYAEKQITKEPN